MSHYSISLHKGGAGKASNTSVLLNESWTCFQLTLVRILKCAWVGAMVLCFSWSDLDISASYFQQTLWLVSFTRDKYKTRGFAVANARGLVSHTTGGGEVVGLSGFSS